MHYYCIIYISCMLMLRACLSKPVIRCKIVQLHFTALNKMFKEPLAEHNVLF